MAEASDGSPHPWSRCELDAQRLLITSACAVDLAGWRHFTSTFALPDTATVSRSSSDGYRAMLIATAGPAGVDIETLDRVARNATVADSWLAEAERTLVRDAAFPVLELACHWVLKEAYGKALGVGLALPFEAISFGSLGGSIVLTGAVTPIAPAHWHFALYRISDRLLAVTFQQVDQPEMPLAPAGRKPPTPVLDR